MTIKTIYQQGKFRSIETKNENKQKEHFKGNCYVGVTAIRFVVVFLLTIFLDFSHVVTDITGGGAASRIGLEFKNEI